MHNKVIFFSFFYILSSTSIIFAMNDGFIKSGCRFLTPSPDKTSWNKIDHNGKLEPSGFKNLTPYSNTHEFEIEHICDDQYRLDSLCFEKTFSLTMPTIQRTTIEDMFKKHQEIYLLLYKNPNKPTVGHYIYPINRIKSHQKTIDKNGIILESKNQHEELLTNNQQLQPIIETKPQDINQLPETSSVNSQQYIFTLKNGFRLTILGIILYLIWSGKMSQLIKFQSIYS
jgi:hypothetical protein